MPLTRKAAQDAVLKLEWQEEKHQQLEAVFGDTYNSVGQNVASATCVRPEMIVGRSVELHALL